MSAQQCRLFLDLHFETIAEMLHCDIVFCGFGLAEEGMREYGLTGTIAYGEGA